MKENNKVKVSREKYMCRKIAGLKWSVAWLK